MVPISQNSSFIRGSCKLWLLKMVEAMYEGRLKSFEPNIERMKIWKSNLVHKNSHISWAYQQDFLVITTFISILQVFELSVSGENRNDQKRCYVSPEQCSSAFISGCNDFGGSRRSNGASSGEYGGCETIWKPQSGIVAMTTTGECAGALFWWNKTPFVIIPKLTWYRMFKNL